MKYLCIMASVVLSASIPWPSGIGTWRVVGVSAAIGVIGTCIGTITDRVIEIAVKVRRP